MFLFGEDEDEIKYQCDGEDYIGWKNTWKEIDPEDWFEKLLAIFFILFFIFTIVATLYFFVFKDFMAKI